MMDFLEPIYTFSRFDLLLVGSISFMLGSISFWFRVWRNKKAQQKQDSVK